MPVAIEGDEEVNPEKFIRSVVGRQVSCIKKEVWTTVVSDSGSREGDRSAARKTPYPWLTILQMDITYYAESFYARILTIVYRLLDYYGQ